MIKWILISLAALLCGLAIHLYLHLGFQEDVKMIGEVTKEFHFLGKKHTGPFHKISAVIAEVEKWAFAKELSCSSTFGYYIDDPRSAEEDRLRSEGGCVLPSKPSIPPTGLPQDYIYRFVESQNYIVFEFSGSPAIGPIKVYPKAEEWLVKNRKKVNGPIVEIYKTTGPNKLTTTYYYPLEK